MILYGQQVINVGTSANDKTGDPLRTAFQKVNANFSAIYDSIKLKAPLFSPKFSGTLSLGTGSLTMTGSLASTGSRVLKGWFTDLEVTNAITGSITGNAATVTGFNRGTYGANLVLSTLDSYTLTLTMSGGDQNFTFPAVATGTLATTDNLLTLVPYSGASSDLNLDDKNLYTSGNIGSSADNVTHGYFGDITVTNPLRARIRSDSIIWGDGDRQSIAATNLKDLEILGSSVKAMTLGLGIGETKAQVAMVDNSLKFIPVYVRVPTIITGVKLGIQTQGDYTADNYNGVGLYKYNTTLDSLELVASSTDDADIWKASSGTMITKAFSTTYNADEGLYYVGCLWNASATTAAPQVYGTSPGIWVGGLLSSGYFIAGAEAGQNTLPAIYKASEINTSSTSYFLFLY